MSIVVTNYKIYCETESKYVSGWGTMPPTTCYNNNTHTVNPNSVQIISNVASNEVIINQKNAAPNGRFHIECVHLNNCAPNSTTTLLHTFDITMSLHSFNFALSQGENGDLFSIAVNLNTPVGLIASDAKTGDTKINIQQAIVPYMYPGLYLTLSDGTNTHGPSKILSSSAETNTVTIKNALTHDYSASNTMILLNYYVIKDMPIILGTMYSFGGDIINASIVQAGMTALFTFYNSGSTSKDIGIYLSGLI